MNHEQNAGGDIGRRLTGYLPQFLLFTFRRFPSARVVLALAIFGVLFEYVALSLMLPLVGRVGASQASQAVTRGWDAVISVLGLPATRRTWLWLFLCALGIRLLINYAHVLLNARVAKRIHAYLSDRVFTRVVCEEPLKTIYRRSIGHFVSLAGDETHKAGSIFFAVGQIIASGLGAMAGLVVLGLYSRVALLAMCGFIAVCGMLLYRAMRTVLTLSAEALKLSRELNTTFIEALNGLRSVRSLSAEPYIVGKYKELVGLYVSKLFRVDMVNQGAKMLPALLLVALGVVWQWPTRGAVPGDDTVAVLAVTTIVIRVLTALGEVVAGAGRMIADISASSGIGELLRENRGSAATGTGTLVDGKIVEAKLCDVECGYKDGEPVISNASCCFSAGRSYAIVGKSGAGKSTVADALLGLLEVQSGAILYNGVPLTKGDYRAIRMKAVLVEQQTRVFFGSLRDNVLVGYQADDDAVNMALEDAGLQELLRDHREGLETILQYQGANLSGGQRQRIGIARALVRQPDVLILDEVTSAVDSAMKATLVSRLKSLYSGRIIIFITHDREVLTAVDEVWSVVDGTIKRSES